MRFRTTLNAMHCSSLAKWKIRYSWETCSVSRTPGLCLFSSPGTLSPQSSKRQRRQKAFGLSHALGRNWTRRLSRSKYRSRAAPFSQIDISTSSSSPPCLRLQGSPLYTKGFLLARGTPQCYSGCIHVVDSRLSYIDSITRHSSESSETLRCECKTESTVIGRLIWARLPAIR